MLYYVLTALMMVLGVGVEVGVEISFGDYYKEPKPVTTVIPTMPDEMVVGVWWT